MSSRSSMRKDRKGNHDFVNALRVCLGLAPLPLHGPHKTKRPKRESRADIHYHYLLLMGDGNRQVRAKGSSDNKRVRS